MQDKIFAKMHEERSVLSPRKDEDEDVQSKLII